ncbi:phosphoribosyl-ATP pyrophosphatase [Neisseria gonorrhoeae]|uniref:phosphoribosyl-ATP diphosphatase n=1 Tax=Neisseria gonorrhoeae TaxID=485 RepID=A0A378VZL1_NEIGO|nr:phosphoribosyl-ATP pyrophosphatase [Neisseria gonorrhoeae]
MPSETLRRHFPTKRNRRIAESSRLAYHSEQTETNRRKSWEIPYYPPSNKPLYSANLPTRPNLTSHSSCTRARTNPKKVIEEAGEVLMASKDKDPSHLVYEVADLWFHTMILLTHHDLKAEDVLDELSRRQGCRGWPKKPPVQNPEFILQSHPFHV